MSSPRSNLIFRQLLDTAGSSSTLTYVLGCPETMEAVIIDPVDVNVDRDLEIIEQLGLTLKFAVNTHIHADHATGTGIIKSRLPECRSVVSAASLGAADTLLNHGDKVSFGSRFLTARSTPGHTDGCMSFVLDDGSRVFTGDTLLIRGCGRTDFQQGSSAKLYASVNDQIFSLRDDCLVYPGHDYRGRTVSSVAEEKTFNPRLKVGTTVEQFNDIMAGLQLSKPKRMDEVLPYNMRCGIMD